MARLRGSKNKVGATAKENILAVFTRLGSTAAMAEWAAENKTEFYKLYARLIPQEVAAKVEHTHKVDVSAESELAARLGTKRAAQPTVQ